MRARVLAVLLAGFAAPAGAHNPRVEVVPELGSLGSAPAGAGAASAASLPLAPSALIPALPASAVSAPAPVPVAPAPVQAAAVKPVTAQGRQSLIKTLAAPALDVSNMNAGDASGAAEEDFNARAQLGGPAARERAVASAPAAPEARARSRLAPAARSPSAGVRGLAAPRPAAELAAALLSEPRLFADVSRAASSLSSPPASEGALLGLLGRALLPALRARAEELGFASPDAYAGWVLSEAGISERAGLSRRLALLPDHSGEMYSGFFRSRSQWTDQTRAFLDRLVSARVKAGRRELRVKSLGVGTGQEPYSLAILTEAALRAAGEDPAAWSVEIEAYDINARSLWAVTQGVFGRDAVFGFEGAYGGGVPAEYAELTRELFPAAGARFQALPRLRSWMKPVFLDLNDAAQQTALDQAPGDILFANNTMIHMRHGATVSLADRLLRGTWARRDSPAFLNLSGMLVTEIEPAGRRAGPAALESSNPLTVMAGASAAGAQVREVLAFGEKMYTGMGSRPSAPARAARAAGRAARWLASPGAWGQAWGVVRAARAHEAALALTPSLEKPLSPGLLDLAESAARARGLALALHFDVSPARVDPGVGALSVNAAWLFADSPDKEARKRAALASILQGMPPAAPRPELVARERYDDPTHGEGTVAAVGALDYGGTVRAVRFADGPRLLWLSGGRYRPVFGLRRSE